MELWIIHCFVMSVAFFLSAAVGYRVLYKEKRKKKKEIK